MLISKLLGYLLSKVLSGRLGLVLHKILLFIIYGILASVILFSSMMLVTNKAMSKITPSQAEIIKTNPEKTYEILSTVPIVQSYIKYAPILFLIIIILWIVGSIKAKKYYEIKKISMKQIFNKSKKNKYKSQENERLERIEKDLIEKKLHPDDIEYLMNIAKEHK